MDNELYRNGSGYVDKTAYKALKNIQKGENKMEFKRGEIYQYTTANGETKFALIVSADWRATSKIVSHITLSEESRNDVSIPISCYGIKYAECEKVAFSWGDRFENYIRTATKKEMDQIDECIKKCLGLEDKVIEVPVEKEVVTPIDEITVNPDIEKEIDELTVKLHEATVKAEIFEKLYKDLLADVMKG